MGVEPSGRSSLAGEIQRRIEQIYELPPMPDMARRILALRADPDASSADLVAIVELDPSLAAQVIRYATSPYYGYSGRIESLHDAITRVLGFDLVMNMALGLSTSKTFRNPCAGPLGLEAFWRHAVFTASFVQSVVKRLPAEIRPEPGMAYLAGLLHNFGFLLLGHLFPPEFKLLNKLAAANPNTPITSLEKCVLGMGQAQELLDMGHAQIGAWLMQSWGMPEELIVTIREHHHPDYQGEHAVYPQLILLANHLLKRHGIGDAPTPDIPAQTLQLLGLTEASVEASLEQLLDGADMLESMARQLAVDA